MKHNSFKIAVAAVLSSGICMWQTSANAEASKAEQEFLKKASEINIAEIQAGELAQKKGTSSQVKMLGEHMVKDHKKAEQELEKLASSKGAEIKGDTTTGKKMEAMGLENASGEKFDKEFAEHQVKDHERGITLFRTAAKESKDPDVKAFAEKQIPVLESHLSMAKSAAGGSESKAGGASSGGHEKKSGGNQ